LTVNGERHDVLAPAHRTLLDLLRDQLGLTGAKKACNAGICGACTVLLDGEPARACLCLAANVGDRPVTTVEGLSPGNSLSAVQRAFVDTGAIQCGFCMTGMIVSATALLDELPDPDVGQIREGLSGNLCRCSGYVKVVEAVQLAARYRREEMR
ncbi:MAG: (2Fe-2S)-binding protein, partial [Sneathiellaceae bacterium]